MPHSHSDSAAASLLPSTELGLPGKSNFEFCNPNTNLKICEAIWKFQVGEMFMYLMGSPKYWLAMPTVAPVMQITKDTL